MNFTIVEGEDPHYYDQYEDFVRLYNECRITVGEIRVKLGISLNKYLRYREKALEENKIPSKRGRSRRRKPKY